MDEYEEAVLFTLALLESRLDRLEYILGGPKQAAADPPKTVPERIQRIQKSLEQLGKRTALLTDAQQLLLTHKDILTPAVEANEEDGPGLDAAQKAAMVVERAPGFATTASQLKALDDQQIPQTDGFTRLAKLRPRIAEAEDRHLQHALQISLLRKRNGLLVQRVKQVQFLGAGRCWVEWHKRLQTAQRTVARTAFKLKPDADEAPEAL